MKTSHATSLVTTVLGLALAAASSSASARSCHPGMGYGGYAHPHPGMGYGMYGPGYGMHRGMKGHHGYAYKGYGGYGHPMKGHAGEKQGKGYSGYGEQGSQKTQEDASTRQDIVEIARGAGNFDTLLIAVKMAGLDDTLRTKGPFTLFAPTDDAFAKLPVKDLAALLADTDALAKVLTFHVVPDALKSDAVAKLESAQTVQGGSLTFDSSDGVKVNNARVVKADIEASNGVIHVIDSVILPD